MDAPLLGGFWIYIIDRKQRASMTIALNMSVHIQTSSGQLRDRIPCVKSGNVAMLATWYSECSMDEESRNVRTVKKRRLESSRMKQTKRTKRVKENKVNNRRATFCLARKAACNLWCEIDSFVSLSRGKRMEDWKWIYQYRFHNTVGKYRVYWQRGRRCPVSAFQQCRFWTKFYFKLSGEVDSVIVQYSIWTTGRDGDRHK
jgi:hypothetical protein